MPEEQKGFVPTVYEIKLQGHLDAKWSEWFYDMVITHESDGTTILYGPLPDQVVLHSVLERIRDMNLTLINVSKVNDIDQNEDNDQEDFRNKNKKEK
jgi:hypothetical protein